MIGFPSRCSDNRGKSQRGVRCKHVLVETHARIDSSFEQHLRAAANRVIVLS